jgi:hypothetical protein
MFLSVNDRAARYACAKNGSYFSVPHDYPELVLGNDRCSYRKGDVKTDTQFRTWRMAC